MIPFLRFIVYWVVKNSCRLISKVLFPFRVHGWENVPATGSFIVASNHLSNLDPVIYGSMFPHRMSFVAKDSLFHNRFLGELLICLGAFPIKRGQADVGALRESIKRIQSGSPLLIFPEGGRAGAGGARKSDGQAYAGIGFLAARTGVPIIPVRIFGSDRVMPPGCRSFRRHPIDIVLGAPLVFSRKESYPQIAEKIMNEIQALANPRSSAASDHKKLFDK